MPANKPETKKYFDVAKPGKSMPSSNSRATIIKNRTVMTDPMVNSSASAGTINIKSDDDAPVSTTAPRLEPLSAASKTKSKTPTPRTEPAKTESKRPAAKPDKAPTLKIVTMPGVEDLDESTGPESTGITAEASSAASDDSPRDTMLTEVKPEDTTPVVVNKTTGVDVEAPAAEAADPEDSSRPVDSEETPAPAFEAATPTSGVAGNEDDAALPESQADIHKQAVAQKEVDAKAQALEKKISDKVYFVPIGEKKKKRSKKHRTLSIVLILLGCLLLADLAIDSGMIKTSIEPPVRLFKTPE